MNGCGEYYIVRPGDTLNDIAQLFNTTVENILLLNDDIDENNLQVGRRICVVSQTVQPVTCPFGTLPYNINSGDTLLSIANRFNTTVSSLIETNPGLNPYNLTVGQRICISEPIEEYPECESGNFYIIRTGDNLSVISDIFNVKISEILEINPGLNPNNLQIGQIICIPLAPSPIEIVINISAKRLTVYRNGSIYREYIVATGKPTTPTPTGSFTVINKQIDPGGPYGTRWLGLSKRGYGIHGTNNPSSIGTAASNGCIRMYNEDIESLFNITSVGTPVLILP